MNDSQEPPLDLKRAGVSLNLLVCVQVLIKHIYTQNLLEDVC